MWQECWAFPAIFWRIPFCVTPHWEQEGLAALNLAISVYSFLSGAGPALGDQAGPAGMRFLYARGDREEGTGLSAGRFFWAFCVRQCFCWPAFCAEQLGSLLGAEGQVLKMTAAYLRIILCFSPCFLLNNILLAFVRSMTAATGWPWRPCLPLFQYLLDYLFLFPLSLGMSGAAFAHRIGAGDQYGPAVSLHLIQKKERFSPPPLPAHGKHGSMAVRTWAFLSGNGAGFRRDTVGFQPAAAPPCRECGSGGLWVTANLALVATAVFTGISQGIQPLISHAYGQRDRRAEGLVRNKALVLALGLSVLLFLAVLLWAPRLTAIF